MNILTDDEVLLCATLTPIQITEFVLRPKFNGIVKKADRVINLEKLGREVYNNLRLKKSSRVYHLEKFQS